MGDNGFWHLYCGVVDSFAEGKGQTSVLPLQISEEKFLFVRAVMSL